MLNSVLMALSLRGVEIHLMIFLGTDYTEFTDLLDFFYFCELCVIRVICVICVICVIHETCVIRA